MKTRYEDYANISDASPFVFHTSLERTPTKKSHESNWHEDLEIQLCEDGYGEIIINGIKHHFTSGDIAVINSNDIHYTGTDIRLVYTCLIIKSTFCKNAGINCNSVTFNSIIKNDNILELINEFSDIYFNCNSLSKTAKLNRILLSILIELTDNHSKTKKANSTYNKSFEKIKSAVKYIRDNYENKITLNELSERLFTDKYALCRDFKKFTGLTIIEYLNIHRCQKAAELLEHGLTVSETYLQCGFENASFFTKNFKKYIGLLPSEYKKQHSRL